MDPNHPDEYRDFLVKIFPSFAEEWEEDEECLGVHNVFGHFTDYFSCNQKSFSPEQLAILGDFINKSVRNDDVVENAISTCFLEHLVQIGGNRILMPYLDDLAKKKMHP